MTILRVVLGTVILGGLAITANFLQVFESRTVRTLFGWESDETIQFPVLKVSPCEPGTTVRPSTEWFHLKFVVIDDGDAVRAIRANESGGDDEIRLGIRAGTVRRFSGVGSLDVRITGLVTDMLPVRINYLTGNEVCQRALTVLRGHPGAVSISVPILGGEHLAEASIVLPRRILETSPQVQMCVEPTFPLANKTDRRMNIYCGFLGSNGRTTALFDSVQQGRQRRSYLLVRSAD